MVRRPLRRGRIGSSTVLSAVVWCRATANQLSAAQSELRCAWILRTLPAATLRDVALVVFLGGPEATGRLNLGDYRTVQNT